MSIPLSLSPFKEKYPCKHCEDHAGKLYCNKDSKKNLDECEECTKICRYYSACNKATFEDRTDQNLRNTWVPVKDNVYKLGCSHCGAEAPMKNETGEHEFTDFCPKCGKRMYRVNEQVTEVEPGIYQHYKGRYYKVICTAQHSETGSLYVVYQALYGKYVTYVRPLEMFIELIEDVNKGYRGPRFIKIEEI